jgi:basic membrane protein A
MIEEHYTINYGGKIMRKQLFMFVALLAVLLMVAAQCGAPAAPEGPAPAETGKEFKFAAIFPGVITDADYNTLGYIGATAVQSDLGLEMAYSESVAVPDVERVMREYIDNGFNIIFTHGGQFVSQTITLANEFPDVYFIGEGDSAVEDPPPNFWIIDRNFHVGFYAIGALAAKQSQTGKVGYIGGLSLPFSYAEVHAMEQAVEDLGLDAEIKPVWAGNFNDPTKARELTDAMLAEDVDVIVGSLNLGMFGLFEAVKGAGGDVWATAKYVDKSNYAPDNYLTAVLYDWAEPLKEITQKIMNGETGGYYPLQFGTGFNLQMPVRNSTDEINKELEQIVADIEAGKIEVVKNTEPIE